MKIHFMTSPRHRVRVAVWKRGRLVSYRLLTDVKRPGRCLSTGVSMALIRREGRGGQVCLPVGVGPRGKRRGGAAVSHGCLRVVRIDYRAQTPRMQTMLSSPDAASLKSQIYLHDMEQGHGGVAAAADSAHR